jgi:hypothetical protein
MRRRGTLGVVTVLALAVGGCGDSLPSLSGVSGKITLDGKPVDGAMLTFMPDSGNRDLTQGTATSDAEGAFRVKNGERDGLAPGKYKVVAIKRGSDTKGAADITSLSMGKDLLPTVYGDASKTTLTIDVPSSGTSSANLELSSKAAK